MEFDEGAALSLCDRNGFINKENFFDFAVKTNLVDWTDLPKIEKKPPEITPRKHQTFSQRQKYQHQQRGRGLCCCGRRPVSPEDEQDRIDHAFRKMDPNNTGFVSWKQFKKVKAINLFNFELFTSKYVNKSTTFENKFSISYPTLGKHNLHLQV